MIGCAGGGSNLSGLIFPFVKDALAGKGPRLVAAEPAACPSLTRGRYAYDFGDTAGMAPMAHMYTLGHTFLPSGIHAGGLRYHGMSPIVSMLRHLKVLEKEISRSGCSPRLDAATEICHQFQHGARSH